MPSGLVALLDDVASITKMAAASLDDVGAAAAKAGSKAAGVVVDDAAVTPRYVTDFTPDRELPIIWAITKGSLRNKLLILLPVAIALSALLPAAIPVLLICGGAFLCFEGAEKVIEALSGGHEEEDSGPIEDAAAFEKERVGSAVRTDFILSAEIMAIALSSVADKALWEQAVVLAFVGIGITFGVYGVVGLIVKMDDAGLALAKRPGKTVAAFGRGLVTAMPIVLSTLAWVGVVAMLWVGGHILLVGMDELGFHLIYGWVHHLEVAVHDATGGFGPALGWLTNTFFSAVLGLIVGAIVVAVLHLLPFGRKHEAHAPRTAGAAGPHVEAEPAAPGVLGPAATEPDAEPHPGPDHTDPAGPAH